LEFLSIRLSRFATIDGKLLGSAALPLMETSKERVLIFILTVLYQSIENRSKKLHCYESDYLMRGKQVEVNLRTLVLGTLSRPALFFLILKQTMLVKLSKALLTPGKDQTSANVYYGELVLVFF
jgi:hypothetical protein